MIQPIVKNIDSITVISKEVDYDNQIGIGIKELKAFATENNIICIKKPFAIFSKHNLSKSYAIEVCVPVIKDTVRFNACSYKIQNIESQEVVSFIYNGNVFDMKKTYKLLYKWMKDNNYISCGPVREIYMESLNKDKQIQLEIQIPIKPIEIY
ncbi:GyrI-like domain-containing protein [Clostridium sporogenes]|uniref:GyrI-like domain-containing protein n=1 Tax=Clostridium sporogenes TaxID=1509 RepID=UPI0006B27275|nr:GyrI-like domain-containing protein [Clostridium sporogenes]KOY65417.1 hypothetical protein AN649_13135 [Clostridium sporogenes]MDS1006652.1 GyrI-like domain-containing protein [Clostridium sporogenes]